MFAIKLLIGNEQKLDEDKFLNRSLLGFANKIGGVDYKNKSSEIKVKVSIKKRQFYHNFL